MPLDLVAIGKILRDAREQKGLTTEQVSEMLYLKKSIILALESGDWAALPHIVYAKGYLLQYARYLKVYDQVAPSLALEKGTQDRRIESQVHIRIKEGRERLRLRKAILGVR